MDFSKVGEKLFSPVCSTFNRPKDVVAGCPIDKYVISVPLLMPWRKPSTLILISTGRTLMNSNLYPIFHRKKLPCNRILWYGEGIHQKSYTRWESQFSGHRPVCATFLVFYIIVGIKKTDCGC
ncbi:hypothetical protein L1987_45243 [Smallanthus sonchifolius]|uniref:Uncharacterized protein n=1 Tax=Smallanthus sonchifolius TaxID=185202 RepID=A0ACB9GSQ2_9ASTR|nr:hypothetical protein L1987_45243 [Smallanthus sonchifolius]